MKKLFFISVLFACFLWNCGKDDGGLDNPGSQQPDSPGENVLVLSVSDLIFNASGGSQEFIVYCAGEWTLTSGSEWCRPESTAGVGEVRVKVSADASTLASDRNVVLTAKSGTLTKSLTVTQKGVNALTLSKDKFDVPQEGGELTIEVNSNMDYTVAVPAAFGSWLKQAEGTKAMQARSYRFTVDAHEGEESREGYIVVGGGELSDTVRIYQAPQTRLVLTEHTCSLTSEAQEFEVELRTNVDYKVVIPDSVENWVSCLQETRALRTDRIRLAVSENRNKTTRTAAVIVKDRNGERADTLHISQKPSHVLLLGQQEAYVKADGGTLAVSLTTDVDYDVVIPDSVSGWVSRLETKALRAEELRFTVARNGSEKARSAAIIIKERAGKLNDTLHIRQLGQNNLLLGNKEFDVRAEGEAILPTLAEKGDYELVIPDSVKLWISPLKGNPEAFGFFVSPNGVSVRTAVVIVKERISGLCDTVRIRQAQRNSLYVGYPKEFNLKVKGGTINVRVTTNVDYEVMIPDSVSDWVSRVETRAYRNEEIILAVAENSSGRVRTAKIIIQDKEQVLSDTVKLVQATKSLDGLYVGDIEFRTEEDLTDFYDAGYTRVQGNVKVTSTYYTSDALKTLEKLGDQLVEIDGTLTLNNYSLADLKGLGGLKKITGDLVVMRDDNLMTFEGLEALESIGGSLEFTDPLSSSNTSTFEGLEHLTNIGGNLKVQNRSVKGLSSLKSIGGNLSAESVEGLERLESIGGDFIMYGSSFKGLNSLSSIGGDLQISSSSLESFEGLENLTSIGGSLKLYACSSLVSFKGLSGLKQIPGNFELNAAYYGFKLLSSFEGLENVESIGGDFKLIISYSTGASNRYDNELFQKLTSFKGLNSLKHIGGNFELNADLKKFEINSSYNSISIFNALTSFEGLETLESIGGSFKISAVAASHATAFYTCSTSCFSALTSFRGLSGLRTVGGDFEVNAVAKDGSTSSYPQERSASALDALTSFEGLESLQSIGGSLKVTASTAMENTAEPQPVLTALKSLASFGGLNALTKINGEGFTATGCPALSDFCTLKNALQNLNGNCNISGNAYNPTKEQILNGQCSQ